MSFRYIYDLLDRNTSLIRNGAALYLVGAVLGSCFVYFAEPSSGSAGSSVVPDTGDISFATIAKNNILATAIVVSGAVFAGAPTILVVLYSGVVHGGVFVDMVLAHSSIVTAVGLYLPHAVFEFPGIWTASAAGFRIPSDLYRYMRGSTDTAVELRAVTDTIALAAIALVLIVIGAFVEATVTAEFASNV